MTRCRWHLRGEDIGPTCWPPPPGPVERPFPWAIHEGQPLYEYNVTEWITDECLPWRERKVRSTDDPWITDEIRCEIRRRKRRFDKWQRGPRWKQAKETTDHLIKESKEAFYKEAVEKLKQKGSSQLPYKALRELAIPDRPDPWTVNETRPGLSNTDLAEKLASYFVRVTDEFEPIDPDYIPPVTFDSPYDVLMPHQVAAMIRGEKKSKSAVQGDMLPSLANEYSDLTAVPATRIMNFALAKKTWPLPWKQETQTAIPKKDQATDFDNLRNLSCTNSLAKILESRGLKKLRNEVTLRNNQNGGI